MSGYRDFMGDLGTEKPREASMMERLVAPRPITRQVVETRQAAPIPAARTRVPFGTPTAAPRQAPVAPRAAPRTTPTAAPQPGVSESQRQALAQQALARMSQSMDLSAPVEPIPDSQSITEDTLAPIISTTSAAGLGETLLNAAQPPPAAIPPNPGVLMSRTRSYMIPDGHEFTIKGSNNA